MINQDKWIKSLPKANKINSEEINLLDHDRWINTIPKKNKYSSFKKYSFVAILFVSGLLLVSALKNETRNLQKEINNLETSINVLKFNLDQATLDNEVITSPENISKLAKEHLNTELVFYKRSQIKSLSDKIQDAKKINKKIVKEKKRGLPTNVKLKVIKKIEEKKTEIRKLQALYSNPKSIPGEIKNKIKKKKIEFKEIYKTSDEKILLIKAQKWAAIQVVKVFFGIPIIPGK